MNVKINSRFTVTLRNNDNVLYSTKKHNAIYQSYQNLLGQLLVSGSPYPKGQYYPPSNVYIVLLNNGNIVKQIPVTLESFNENFNTISTSSCNQTQESCNLQQMSFTLKHTAVDSSTDSYTFDTIEIVAGTSTSETYAIAYTNINSVTKSCNDTLTVSWEATVTIVSNGILYLPGCSNPYYTNNYSINGVNYFPSLCINLPYILVALSLIPYNQIPQNSFLYESVNALLTIFGASLSSAEPTLDYQGVQYYVINNQAYPINQPYQSEVNSTVNVILLYGVNDDYFFYTLPISQSLSFGMSYTPALTINFTLE